MLFFIPRSKKASNENHYSKHMDKHDRPYICTESGCEKIRGFTYSGGLLRHQREVHKKHGGPKVPLMCPHKDCKRSTGKMLPITPAYTSPARA